MALQRDLSPQFSTMEGTDRVKQRNLTHCREQTSEQGRKMRIFRLVGYSIFCFGLGFWDTRRVFWRRWRRDTKLFARVVLLRSLVYM